MLARGRMNVFLLLLIGFAFFNTRLLARDLTNHEASRLYSSVMSKRGEEITIDIRLSKEVVTKPEAVNKRNRKAEEDLKKLSEKLGQSLKLGSYGLVSPDGTETLLSESRIRIGCGLKLRSDVTVFANKERTESSYQGTTINTGFRKDSPSYQIDHTSKQALIFAGRRWSGQEVLRFGRINASIALDVIGLCNPTCSQGGRVSKSKKLSYKGTNKVDGKAVDEIECVNPESGKVKYKIFLDTLDWSICRKIVRYDDNSGLVSKISECKKYERAGGSEHLFPRLVFTRSFDKEGKEEKNETIYVTDLTIGAPISEEIFKLDVPTDYTIVDNRSSP